MHSATYRDLRTRYSWTMTILNLNFFRTYANLAEKGDKTKWDWLSDNRLLFAH